MKDISMSIFGSDIIELLLDIHHPMMMVDSIKAFDSKSRTLDSIKMISSNEPVFQGHFPGLKLWPGIYTMEGMKQSILLFLALQDLESKAMTKKISKLQSKMRNLTQPFSEENYRVINYLNENFPLGNFLYTFKIKLAAPIYSESIIHYSVRQESEVKQIFSVSALVNNKLVAKGEIRLENV
jgi:3-hydroxymyristoyl/3-hydroxydecanoyl-(acyl carrier protein) dehydratase